jgi:hypothetical protein
VWERRKGKMMKKVTILLLIISSFAFAGGEISFKKQNEKLRRLEDAKLESIRNNISDKQKGNVVNEENPEPENTDSRFEDEETLNLLKKKEQNMKSL